MYTVLIIVYYDIWYRYSYVLGGQYDAFLLFGLKKHFIAWPEHITGPR